MIEHRSGRASTRAHHIRTLCRLVVKPTLSYWPMRGPLKHGMGLPDLALTPMPGLTSTKRHRIRGHTWHGELVTPRTSEGDAEGAILYLHGGAFLLGGTNTHRRLVHRLCDHSGLPVLSVAYRQHVKGDYADSLDDSEAAFHRLVERGIGPSRIVLAGDSAGGTLAFALAMRLATQGIRPAAVVGYSPWLDFDDTQKLVDPNAATEPMLPVRRLGRAGRMATRTPSGEPLDPTHSPLYGDVSSLPPVLMYCSADEVLRIDAEHMAERLDRAGVPHSLVVWEGMLHAFPVLGHLVPESRAVIEETAAFVKRVTTGRPVAAVA
jgi:acetyl esterase/lipase